MFDKKLIIRLLNEDFEQYQYYKKQYEDAENPAEKQKLWGIYLRYMSCYSARVQVVCAFGYDVIRAKNGKITGLKLHKG